MKPRLAARLLITTLLINPVACGYVKSLFPDKGKDYQYTTEIASLTLPDDLKQKSASEPSLPAATQTDMAGAATPPAEIAASAETTEAAVASEPTTAIPNEAPAEPAIEPVEKFEKISVELIRFNDGENRLRLGVESPRAWRIVSKALSRKSIEVTNRNQADKLFTIQYDPDEQPVEDGSLWDEAVFLFRGFKSDEKEYVLKLEEHDRKTEVLVLDKDQQPLPDDPTGLKLLTLLQTAINADLAGQK